MKPNEIITLRAKKTWLLLPSFKGITWMGTVYCRRQKDIDEINRSEEIDSNFKSHEMIHVKQAQAMKNSWFRFYLNYVFNYIKNIPLIFVNLRAPYYLIPTEIEAYINEDNWGYTYKVDGVYQWKLYQRMKFKEKWLFAKEYFANKPRKKYSIALKDYFKNRTFKK